MTITICYAFNKDSLELLKISMYSILNYNKDVEFYIFHLGNLEDAHKQELNPIYNRIIYVNISPWMDIFKNTINENANENSNDIQYIKFLMPNFFKKNRPTLKRFIYCQENCYCVGDITKLWKVSFQGDIYGFIEGIFTYRCPFITKPDNTPSLDSGLLVIKNSFNLLSKRGIYMLNINKLMKKMTIVDALKRTPIIDKFLINIYGCYYEHNKELEISQDNGLITESSIMRIKRVMNVEKEYGIINTFLFKNNEDELIEMEFIKEKCKTTDRGNDKERMEIVVDKNNDAIEDIRKELKLYE